MNAGLGNLTIVKKHLLPATMVSESRFDDVILDISQGVAALIEQWCNRKFQRTVDDTAIFQADRMSFILPRYPVESISKVETRETEDDSWEDVTSDNLIKSTSLASGVIYFGEGADAGKYWSSIRFTYTGGYWFEDYEPSDDGYPQALPSGAARLPIDLKLAWLMQCRDIWSKFDKLGTGLNKEGTGNLLGTTLGALEFSKAVISILHNYKQILPI
jgi:hypothetical protein